jgi:transcriptional regulator with XRE-family HTH domain
MPRGRRTLAGALKRYIDRSGQSMPELAAATGLSRVTLWRFMAGKRDLTLGTAEPVARELGLELRRARPSRRAGT